eukprot:UN32542
MICSEFDKILPLLNDPYTF